MEKKVFTPEQIAKIKKDKGINVIHVKVFLDEKKKESREMLLKDPLSMDDLSFVSACLAKDDVVKRGEFIIDSLWIDGDDDFRLQKDSTKCVNPRVRLAAIPAANQAVEFLKFEVAKS